MSCNTQRCPRAVLQAGCWLVLLCLSAAGAHADQAAPGSVYGIWASSGTMIEIAPTKIAPTKIAPTKIAPTNRAPTNRAPGGQGGLTGRIIALKHPQFREKDGAGVVGEPKTDLHNPDPALQDRPLLGLDVFEDFRFHKGRWRGRLYLPTDGSSLASKVFVKNGLLHVHGYVGLPLLGRTEKFAPITACNPDIVRMIQVSGLEDTPCQGVSRP